MPLPGTGTAPQVATRRRELFRDPHALTVCLGSCFAEHFHDALSGMGMRAFHRRETCNHFNPVSLADMLEDQLAGRAVRREDVFESSFLSASVPVYTTPLRRTLYDATPDAVVERSRVLDEELVDALSECSAVILTVGTADVMRLAGGGRVVCSGNKVSPDLYGLSMLSVMEAAGALERVYEAIATMRGGAPFEFVVTLSPQRYFWDAHVVSGEARPAQDLSRNASSKRVLRSAIDELVLRAPGVEYFPSFEIVTEELRAVEPLFDAGKFAHVTQSTVTYVVARFVDAYFADELVEFSDAWRALARLRRTAVEQPQLEAAVVESVARLVAQLGERRWAEHLRHAAGRLLEELAVEPVGR